MSSDRESLPLTMGTPASSGCGAPPSFSVAVVIPTRNRPHDLELTVKTLLAQTVLPRELLVVDQSSDELSENRVRALFAGDLREPVQLLYIRDPRISGLTAARNVSLDRTDADIILFLDDDVELEPLFIEEILRCYADDPAIAGVSGVVTNYKPPPPIFSLWTRIFVRGPFFDDRQDVYLQADTLRDSHPIPASRLGGGLMSFRASAIRGLRFDANLTGGCFGEDVDFCMHLPRGSRLVMTPGARLVHNASPVARKDEHWISLMVRGSVYLFYRNWNTGWKNRLCMGWLKTGYAMFAAVASLRRRSSAPWREFQQAIRDGQRLGMGNPLK